jgi:flagellar motor switch protein FliN/FliY
MKRRVQASALEVADDLPSDIEAKESPLLSLDAAIFKNVRVSLQAKLGEVSLSVDDLLKLHNGSVVTLDRQMTDLVDLHLNDALIGRGEIVAVGDNFGLRIVEIADIA